MPVGKPLKFKTPKILGKKIDAYFMEAVTLKEPFSVTSVAVFLDCTLTTLSEYGGEIQGKEKGDDPERQAEYATIVKKAKEKCADYLFKGALMGKLNVIMVIFGLKANHKWRDGNEGNVIINNNRTKIDKETLDKIKETVRKNIS